MKFFIVLVLALAVCDFATAQVNIGIQGDGGLLPVQWDPNDQQLVSLLDSSLQHIIPAAIATGQISSGNWTLSKVNSVGSEVSNETMYQFNVEITNGTGDIVNLVINVYLGPSGHVKFANYSVLKK